MYFGQLQPPVSRYPGPCSLCIWTFGLRPQSPILQVHGATDTRHLLLLGTAPCCFHVSYSINAHYTTASLSSLSNSTFPILNFFVVCFISMKYHVLRGYVHFTHINPTYPEVTQIPSTRSACQSHIAKLPFKGSCQSKKGKETPSIR